jgi:hypothetical protein
MDPVRRPSGLRFLENLAYLVPGYEGYKLRERRREEDSRLRALVYDRLLRMRQALEQIHERWAEEEAGAQLEQLGCRVQRLQTISEAVRYSPYVSTVFFTSDILAEGQIERILEADLLILEDLDGAEDYLERCCLTVTTAPRTAKSFFRAVDEDLGRLERHLIMREKILASA